VEHWPKERADSGASEHTTVALDKELNDGVHNVAPHRRDAGRSLLGTNDTCPSGLFFSQYQEGSAFNKYLELYNPSTITVVLDEYFILSCANPTAASCKSSLVSFPGGASIGAKGTYLVCHPGLQGDKGRCMLNSSSLMYNGDDAVLLAKGNASNYKIVDQVLACSLARSLAAWFS
jgi:hypothetical protein